MLQMISLLLGLVYLQTGAQLCCLTIQNINGVLFLFLTNLTFPYVFGSIEVNSLMVINSSMYLLYMSLILNVVTLQVFCEELPIFLREHLSGLYRVDVYYLTKTMSEVSIVQCTDMLLNYIYFPSVSAPSVHNFPLSFHCHPILDGGPTCYSRVIFYSLRH